MSRRDGLGGRVILVVEDDWLIAEDIAVAIRREGARVVGPAASSDDALRLIEDEPGIDLAVLDVALAHDGGLEVADALEARGVPFVFATGYDRAILPLRFQGAPHWEKPFDADALARFLTAPARPGAEHPA
ncbi:putative two-component response regulator protein [Rubellimicrobium mesophilum DSM 19309]|uniref:Putative two-component response regulator protein n=1 Tax=Rubellimicrobium mesophilum DSM 19309 TaxID=442562 RepID=A0A017HS05_9RHOB|nr:response regulator [Rubellimicrobium mesophilum]EYD76943.1 putative two-component response regulator protein [Rubellimicrobium mesophilum DSM 19309]